MDDHIRTLFLQELEEQTSLLSRDMLALEADDVPPDIVDRLFRAAHSLKGAAQVTGTAAVADVAHGMESVLSAIRARELAADSPVVSALLAAVDWLVVATRDLSDGGQPDTRTARRLRANLSDLAEADGRPPAPATPDQPENPPAESPAAVPSASPSHRAGGARVSLDKLDGLLRQASEVTVASQQFESLAERMGKVLTAAEEHSVRWRRLEYTLRMGDVESPAGVALDDAGQSLRTLTAAIEPLAREALVAERDLHRAAALLFDTVMGLQMIPFSAVIEGLDRVVRDAAGSQGKKVNLTVEGGNIEVDRAVAVALREPLIHLVHNAVDHGIEPSTIRSSAGKNPTGQIRLAAQVLGDRVEVSVSDDGAGLQSDAIRAAAGRKGLPEPQHAQALADMVFAPGLSTAPVVTETSGRGVGLDAVRTRIEGLGGSVGLATEPGAGTTVTALVPITLSIVHTITVAVSDQVALLCSAGVERVVHTHPRDIRSVGGGPSFQLDGRLVPLVDLAEALGWPPAPPSGQRPVPVVVATTPEGPIGLVVADLLGAGDVTTHALGGRIGAAPAVLGVSLLPGGEVAVILSTVACARLGTAGARGGVLTGLSAAEQAAPAPRILLADDTLTTRALERGILEAAGYSVVTAVDGADAWQKLRDTGADLVITDVNMPRMDGFELCEAIRGSGRFEDLPVVLVTSLSDEAHRRRGLDAGASAYIVKSEFDQGVLIDTIERLLS